MQRQEYDFSLNFEVIKGIPFEKYEKNFVFVVNGKGYFTNRFIADILSPIIRQYHCSDETIDEFHISIPNTDTEPQNDYFTDFLQLVNFESIHTDGIRLKYYQEYFLQLGNIGCYYQILTLLIDEMNQFNILDHLTQINLHLKNLKGMTFPDQQNPFSIFERMIKYAAEHFSELPHEKLKETDSEILEEIFKNESFRIDSEDSLLTFILEMYEKDQFNSFLFEYVYFENVKNETLEKFIDCFSYDDLNSGAWKSICCLILRNRNRDVNPSRYGEAITEIKHEEGKEFQGIINYLCLQTGGNIYDNKTIDITADSIISDTYHPKNLIDYENDNYYQVNNSPKAEICFDFKDKSVQLSSYSIKSGYTTENVRHLRNWAVDVSNDKKTWRNVDEHFEDSSVNGKFIIKTFKTKEKSNFYRFVRFRILSVSWLNDYYSYFNNLEFYGKIKHHLND